LLLDVG